jgi:hypothetical protein
MLCWQNVVQEIIYSAWDKVLHIEFSVLLSLAAKPWLA